MDAHELHTKVGASLLDKIAADPELINRPAPGTPPTAAPAPAQPVVLLHPDEHLPAPVPAKGHKLVLGILMIALFLIVSGGGAAAYFSLRPSPAAQVFSTPTATSSPTPIPTPIQSAILSPTVSPSTSPSPSPTASFVPSPSPSPSLTLGASTQEVMVTNPSGLWLRSSPNAQNNSNIVTWVPKGAKISVDQKGSFWCHGAYDGKTGYFAVKYTK